MSTESNRPTVHVVDDDPDVRRSAAFLLNAAGFGVETHASGAALLAAAPTLASGCVLTDVRMPGIDGLDLQEKLGALRADLPVIVMTGHGDVPMAVRALRAGAVDFIEKPFEDETLIGAVKAAMAVSERNAEATRVAERLGSLTAREREVMDRLVEGRLNKQIAHELGISTRTVEVHRASILEKMGAENLASLIRMAFAAGRLRAAGPAPGERKR